MKYTFHPEAEEEFFEAITYYEACDEGLGLDFALAIHMAVNQAVKHPKSWPLVEGEIRRCQTVRFPYSILYTEEAESILILAVMHLHRNPDYWKHRR